MPDLMPDTSIYKVPQPMNPLEAMSTFASTQNALNQNRLFQQEFEAKQAIGPIAQRSVGQNGQMDWEKFAVGVSSDPKAAFLAPQILQSIAQKQLLDQQTITAKLENAASQQKNYASALAPLLPLGDNVTTKDLIGAANQLHAAGMVDNDHLLSFLANAPSDDAKIPVKNADGSVMQRSALGQYIKSMTVMAATRADSLASTISKFAPVQTGAGTYVTRQNPVTGEVAPAGGQSFFPAAPSPSEANAPFTYKGPNGESVTVPRYAAPGMPMVNGAGQQAYSPQGGAAPPVAQGVKTGLSPSASTLMSDEGSKMADYEFGVNDAAHSAQNTLQTLNASLGVLDKFRAGGGATLRQEAAQALQAIPVPEGMVKARDELIGKIMGGNNHEALAAAQEFEKYAAVGAMQTLIAAQGSHYRPAAIEYQTIFKNFPRASVDPKASRDMLQLTKHFLNQTILEQNYMDKFREANGPDAMVRWPAVWTKILAKSGYLKLDNDIYSRLGGKNWNTVNGALNGQ